MSSKQGNSKKPDRRPCRQTQRGRSAINKARRILKNHNGGKMPPNLSKVAIVSAASIREPKARLG